MTGESRFQPAAPSGVSLLTFSWLGLEVPIPIASDFGTDCGCPVPLIACVLNRFPACLMPANAESACGP
jgi:hypothetical protein